MLWFFRGLRRGIVTTRYPAEIDAWTATLPSVPAFHSARLTDELADRLEAACPPGALRHDDGTLVIDLGACTGCGRCIELGGDAVQPSRQFLLAARQREELIKLIPIGGAAGQRASSDGERVG